MVIGGNSDSGGPDLGGARGPGSVGGETGPDLGGAGGPGSVGGETGPDLGGAGGPGSVGGEAGPAGASKGDAVGADEGDAVGADEGDAAGQACGSDGSIRAVERDGSGWVKGAKGRRTWNRKPHAAQT